MNDSRYDAFEPVLSTEAMRDADRSTIEERGIPARVLMETAGRGVADVVEAVLKDPRRRRVLVVCGGGNNGGDGLVAARVLFDRGAVVRVAFTGDSEKLSEESAANLELLESLASEAECIEIVHTTESDAINWFWPEVIIDAVLGVGVQRDLREPARSFCAGINESPAPVVAIDVPSGLDSDTGRAATDAVVADVTVTMAARKAGHLFADGPAHCGQLIPVEIGIPTVDLARMSQRRGSGLLSTDDGVASLLPPRPQGSHKYSAGRVLVIAGSRSFPGAALMSAQAASRAGAGAVVVAVPESARPFVAPQLRSVMSVAMPETAAGTFAREAVTLLLERAEDADAVVLGPGLDNNEETYALVRSLLGRLSVPVVVDADGLNALAGHLDVLRASVHGKCVLTPHLGELRRLLGQPEYKVDRPLEQAADLAGGFGEVVLLKGMPSVVGSPEGQTFVAAPSTPALATAGTGDVLAGVVGGLMAQGLAPADAAIAGLHLSGRAAQHAAGSSTRSVLATDIIDALAAVMPT